MTFFEIRRMGNSALLAFSSCLFAFCLSGCFDEPEPAYKSVPPETQVYLKHTGLRVLTAEALLKEGRVSLGPAGMTNLADRATALDLSTLTYLNLDYNQLTNVDLLVNCTSLKWLRLNGNQLAALPDLSRLVGLRRVYLRGNQLASVPEFLKDLPELTDVDLSGNPITSVPDWLAEKQGLENLSFTGTRLTKLPADIGVWKSLKSLQLGDLRFEGGTNELARIRAALPATRIVF